MVVDHAAAPQVLFGMDPMMVSTAILIFAYAFIISEKINRTIIALLGGALMIFMGVLNQDMAIKGVDFNTIALLTGMMVIVSITEKTGVFQYVAILSAKLVKANPRALLLVMGLITAVFSALLDNVTTVLLTVPITLLLTDQLKINPYPFLFVQIFASNIGGTATLIGDPPNIMIGSQVGLSFMDFVNNVGLPALLCLIFIMVFFDFFWGRKMVAAESARAAIMRYVPAEAIEDKGLLIKSLIVLALVLAGFILGHDHGLMPGTVALAGAALLMLLQCVGLNAEKQSHKVHESFQSVEWGTIFFFIGLFVLVYGVEVAGVLNLMATKLLDITNNDLFMASMVVLWSSAVLSAIVDNIPFVATMIPLIKSTTAAFGGPDAVMPLWWSLSLGACLGGNGSLIGASANVMVAGFAERAGHRISFLKFMALAFPLMLVTIAISTVYVWWAFF